MSGMRTNQIERTRSAIVAAARALADTGGEITMPAIAAEARVSEATAYRHFPDLISVLRAAIAVEDHVAVLRAANDSDDPVERIAQATEILSRSVLRRQGVVRAIVASTIAKPATAKDRPAHRFGLIEYALGPWIERHGREQLEPLIRDLAVIVSAESLFTLIDLYGLPPEEAIASLVDTARRTTRAGAP
jgi:AcrR family transcriptional regulator